MSYQIVLNYQRKEIKQKTSSLLKNSVSDYSNDTSAPDLFGRYGDVCFDNTQPAIHSAKLRHFDSQTRRRAEAKRCLSAREKMPYIPSTASDVSLFSMAEKMVLRDRCPNESWNTYKAIPKFLIEHKNKGKQTLC